MTIPTLPSPLRADHYGALTTASTSVRALAEGAARDAALRSAAEQLEATFLATMLKFGGWDAREGGFGGGPGEGHFMSFLHEAQAERIVDTGGIGLAESLFEALKARR